MSHEPFRDDPDFALWLRGHRAKSIESELLGVAEAGADYAEESGRDDPAHKARLSRRRAVLEAAIQSYNEAVAQRGIPISAIEPDELARLVKLFRKHQRVSG